MRFPCYALILCLSILFPLNLIAADPQPNPGDVPVERAITAAPAPVAQPAAAEAAKKVQSNEGSALPGTAPVTAQSDAASANQVRQSILNDSLSKLVNSYNDLNAKYADLSQKYEKLQNEMAVVRFSKEKQNAEPAASVQKEAEQVKTPEAPAEEITSYAAAQELAKKMNAAKAQKPAEPATDMTMVPGTAPAEPAKDSGPEAVSDRTAQYVKLKLQEDGREVEFMLDPMYVDMNFNFKRSTAAAEVKPEQPNAPQQSQTQPQAQQMPQQAQSQPQMPPQIQYVPYQPPQQYPQSQYQPQMPQQQASPQQQPAVTEKSQSENRPQQFEVAPRTAGTREVLDGIYKAQKYYYEKRYTDALKAVQNSLLANETALGYALEGSIYYTLGDANAAGRSWRSALRLNPDMEDVKTALERYGR